MALCQFRRKIMIIGIPKEIMHEEARVAATPETVKKMVADGLTVLFEKVGSECEVEKLKKELLF